MDVSVVVSHGVHACAERHGRLADVGLADIAVIWAGDDALCLHATVLNHGSVLVGAQFLWLAHELGPERSPILVANGRVLELSELVSSDFGGGGWGLHRYLADASALRSVDGVLERHHDGVRVLGVHRDMQLHPHCIVIGDVSESGLIGLADVGLGIEELGELPGVVWSAVPFRLEVVALNKRDDVGVMLENVGRRKVRLAGSVSKMLRHA